ncbi:MAG: CPBP family intramembrane metalloprotease [Spirochaetes bacterium]|nr:CPBP family intramembrane metalloprotease [Spirochaetota bacterium]
MNIKLKPMKLFHSIILFLIPAIYFLFIAYIIIPFFNNKLFIHPALSWFIGGIFVFLPLFITALVLVYFDHKTFDFKFVLARLRIKRITKKDFFYILFGLILIFMFTGFIMFISKIFNIYFKIPLIKTNPPFMEFDPLTGYERYYLIIWLFMFFFNIVGEEILWRGYILPRQELEHRNFSWVINSILWLVFHACFGAGLIILLIPIIIVLPYIAYKTKNTLNGIIIHALLNGPMFIMIALGIIK